MKEFIKKAFIYYLLATLFVSLLLMSYIFGDSIVSQIDFLGWLYFVTSCISHAGIIVLIPVLLLFMPFMLIKLKSIAKWLYIAGVSFLGMLGFVNMQVYKIYRFHINGFIINMLTGPNPGDIFQFDTALYVREGLLLIIIIVVCVLLWNLASFLSKRWKGVYNKWAIVSLLSTLIFANGIHVYGAFVVKPSILLTTRLVPYYFPISMSSALEKWGLERNTLDLGYNNDGDLVYPLNELMVEPDSTKTNIVFILIDSWNKRSLTPEGMPNIWNLKENEQYYDNHVSCSNGTRYSVFGIFTGLQPYYWPAFEGSHTSPLLVNQLLEQGYDFYAYPSATLQSPPFSRVLFQKVKNLRCETLGDSPYERDCRIASDFIKDMPRLARKEKPFFSFVFFDMPHGLNYPTDKPKYFEPAWDYANYAVLNNDMPAEPFWNLYRNLCFATDSLIGQVVSHLKENGLYDNSLVIITGDHSQEFNENHRNYWGHNSNFSRYQIAVPLIAHVPGKSKSYYNHRTTHYDFVPTLMQDYLGVKNRIEDYCVGRRLDDPTPRMWHFVGNELRYAFLLENDTILTKEGAGWITVTDANMNPINDYHINPKKFENVIKNLNRFYK